MVWYLYTRQPDHLNTRQMDAILFSFYYWSGMIAFYPNLTFKSRNPPKISLSGIQMVGLVHRQTIWNPNLKKSSIQIVPVFKWSVFRLYCSFESGRSWTVAGTSLANMFPDQLRVPKRRDESSSSPDTTPQAPLRLSDMLKRKRVSKRTSGTFLNQTKDSHFRTHYYNVNFILIVLLIGIGGIISFKKHSGALVCHLLQDLKVPGSNLRLSQRRNDPVVGWLNLLLS